MISKKLVISRAEAAASGEVGLAGIRELDFIINLNSFLLQLGSTFSCRPVILTFPLSFCLWQIDLLQTS